MVQHMQISAIYHINRMKEKNQDHLNRCIKSIWQIQHPSMIKMQQIGESFEPFTIKMLAMGLSPMAFIMLKYVPSISTSLIIVINKC